MGNSSLLFSPVKQLQSWVLSDKLIQADTNSLVIITDSLKNQHHLVIKNSD